MPLGKSDASTSTWTSPHSCYVYELSYAVKLDASASRPAANLVFNATAQDQELNALGRAVYEGLGLGADLTFMELNPDGFDLSRTSGGLIDLNVLHPLDPSGTAPVDQMYSKAYVRHLFHANELLALYIGSVHNLNPSRPCLTCKTPNSNKTTSSCLCGLGALQL